MAENHILTEKLHAINKLLNDLYEGIDEYYTETLERDDELAIARADAQLQLIKAIIDEVEKMIKKTICVDFDGVLNECNGYEEGNLGKPLIASKEFIRQLRKKYKVVILTSRPKEQVIDWLNNNGFPSMEVTNRKIPAVAYIDDRAIQFKGSYIQTIYEAVNFKPYWMERHYRVYDVETGETEALFAKLHDAEIFTQNFKRNRVCIEILEGVLK